jgi:hypothetical protein
MKMDMTDFGVGSDLEPLVVWATSSNLQFKEKTNLRCFTWIALSKLLNCHIQGYRILY